MIKVTLIYAALLGLLFVILTLRVVKNRFSAKVSLGSGGNTALNVAIRTHANFAEHVPLTLILIMGVEFLSYPTWLVHTLGAALFLARLSHIYGLANKNSLSRFRSVGVISTTLVIITSSILILSSSLQYAVPF